MVKYLLGILTGLVLVFMVGLIVVVIALTMQGTQPSIENDSVLTLRLQGAVPEHIATELELDFLDRGKPNTVLGIHAALKNAAQDDRIRALILYCGGFGGGWGKAQEVRWAIEDFKESGKPVMAFIQVGGTLDYFLASAADRIFLEPEGVLDVKGLRAEVSFYKGTLAKLGIEAEMLQMGKYKSAAEPFSRESMSPEYREVLNSVLDEVYEVFVSNVAPSRGKENSEFEAVLDNGPFVAGEALEAGLVDVLGYRDEFEDAMMDELGMDELKKVGLSRYRKVEPEGDVYSEGHLAVVYAVGDILRGRSEQDPFLGIKILGSDTFTKALKEVREDDSAKAVIVRVDSGGGDAIASDQMWRAVNQLRAEKPVIISMSDVAASGGYYIAAAKDAPILAYPSTYTGSIGVVLGKLNMRGFYDKIGVSKEILSRGRFAEIDTSYRAFTPEEKEKVRSGMEVIYRAFVQKVADARGSEWEEIHELAQGRVWMGSQARENGLIDELGGFGRAITMAKEAAGIEEDLKVPLITYPAPESLWETLFGIGELNEDSRVSAVIRSYLDELPHWPVLLEGGLMRIAPYTIRVQ